MRLLIVITLLISFERATSAQGLTLSPFSDWHVEVKAEDIRAGDDIQSTYDTRSDHLKLTGEVGSRNIFNILFAEWKVKVQREDRGWHHDLDLYIRRTGNRSGYFYGNSVEGANTYMRIKEGPEDLIECRGWRYDIPFQFEIRGVSLLLPAKTYRTVVIFTIIDD